MKKQLYIFGTFGFIAGLALLLLNDHVLKPTFNNELTGKLSDFAGLFIFPIFFSAFFPRFKNHIYVGTALIFIGFKSPLADPLISLWNSWTHLHIARVPDPTDLMALVVLPFSYRYFIKKSDHKLLINPLPIMVLASVGFIATSRSPQVPVTYNQEYVFQFSIDSLKKKIFFHPNILNNYQRDEYLKLDSIEKNSPVYPQKHFQKRKKELYDTYCNRTIYIELKDTANMCTVQTASILIYPNRQLSILKLLEIRYRHCRQLVGKEDKDLLKEIFEREFLKTLYE